jgi:UDP-GlcNAc:undecaprenyl-phosphate/decaprenyl-phosphate GlcNAc-1-phosphate transferase
MAELLWLAGKAFLIALVLTPIIRDISRSFNIVDRPGFRKVHAYPIPRVGGVAIAVAYTITLLSISGSQEPFDGPSAWKLIPGAAIVFLTGVLDDFFSLKPLVKIGGLVAAASIVFWSGLHIGGLANRPLAIWLDYPLTVFWLLLTSNALNLIDGLDGLCAGMGLVSTLALFTAAILHHNVPLEYATFPLAGALLGFLCYNLNPATVFLGDSGALLLGFLLGCYGMIWTQKTSTLLSMLVPLLALFIPLLDVSLSVVRRFLRQQPIFAADREHIHHRLLDRGLSPRQAVGVLYLVAALGAVFALVGSSPIVGKYQGFVALFFCVGAAFGIRQLRYREFGIPSRLFLRGTRQKLAVERLAPALERAGSEEAWWDRLAETARTLGLVSLRLYGTEGVRYQWHTSDQSPAWSFQVTLKDGDSLEMEGLLLPGTASFDLIRFAEVVKSTFPGNRVQSKILPAEKVASAHP